MRLKLKAILLAITLVFGTTTAYTAATSVPADASVLCRSLGPYVTGYGPLRVTTYCSVYPDPVHNVVGTCIEAAGRTVEDAPARKAVVDGFNQYNAQIQLAMGNLDAKAVNQKAPKPKKAAEMKKNG